MSTGDQMQIDRLKARVAQLEKELSFLRTGLQVCFDLSSDTGDQALVAEAARSFDDALKYRCARDEEP